MTNFVQNEMGTVMNVKQIKSRYSKLKVERKGTG